MRPDEYKLIPLPKIIDARGSLTFLQWPDQVPFEIRRIFYLYEIPRGSDRGGHALKRCHQMLIALSGPFSVDLDNGTEKNQIRLDRPDIGLYLPPLIWREMTHFSPGSICLVLASELYDAEDYYRARSDFLRALEG